MRVVVGTAIVVVINDNPDVDTDAELLVLLRFRSSHAMPILSHNLGLENGICNVHDGNR
jgi:hypothetical protein